MSNRKQKPKTTNALGFRDISVADYHRDYSAQSKTMLWAFRNRRRLYEAQFVTKTLPIEPPSRAMEIGTLTHAGLLEPKDFKNRYAVYPPECLNKKGDLISKPAEAFRDSVKAGKIVVKPSELETVLAMVASVQGKIASWLAIDSERERPIYWNEPTTGLLCRCLCDWLITSRDTAFALDLKTTEDADPSSFRYKCEDFGYYLQAEHYSEGISLVTGLPVEFYFIVVERKFPYACSIQKLSPKDRSSAADARRRIIGDLDRCLKSGDFSEPWEHDVTELSLRPSCYAA